MPTMIKHQNNFNFLRLCLANLVLLSHAPEIINGDRSREILTSLTGTLSFGELAVAGFFILSGYLIVQSWTRTPSAYSFIIKRIRRIFPAFIVASLVCALVVGPLGADDIGSYIANFDIFKFLSAMFFLKQPAVPDVFTGTHYPVVNGAMWTISKEFSCYLAVCLAGSVGLLRRRALCVFAAFLLVALLMIDKNGYPRWQVGSYQLNLISYFLIGGCFHLFRDLIVYTRLRVIVAGILLCVGLCFKRTEVIAVCIAGSYLVFGLAFTKFRTIQGFDKFPDVSYGAYLYGWPIQKLIVWYFPEISPWLLFPISLVFAILAGAISWFAVEQWFLRQASHSESKVEADHNVGNYVGKI